ncbi:MAG TPA: MATE family efflux transporter [Candidatus Thermoplasmatota archaeon]|nr:MATE family efflux transporter [Candidatus Thermoplasmatota archaeon]
MSQNTQEKTDDSSRPFQNQTKGVKALLGDPKKAILTLSLPMIVAMVVQTLYNLINRIWVSGLGTEASAAVGFAFPLLFMGTAIATGLGVGGGSAISRKIGAKDKKGGDRAAVHTLIIMVIVALAYAIPLFVFAEDIFRLIGAGEATATASLYARIIYSVSIVSFFTSIATALLRSEGDAKRSMFAMILGGILNAVLDPIFIYVFGWGVAGAAIASVVSISVSAVLLFYWLFLKKNTFLTFHFRGFHFDKSITKDILAVGLPASLLQLSMAIMLFIMNIIVEHISGTDGVAVFSAGWAVAMTASMPLLGMATAVVSVTGAVYGAREYKKLDIAHLYALKIGILIETAIAIATFIFAPVITLAFTTSPDMVHLGDEITTFLRIICIYYPATAFGMLSSSLFQGVGKGLYSLIVTILRTIILIIPLAWLFGVILGWGLPGAWWGLVIANIIGSAITFIWAKIYINSLLKSTPVAT